MRHTSAGLFGRLRVAVGLLCLVWAQPSPAAGTMPEEGGVQADAECLRLMRRTFADKLADISLVNHRGERVRLFSDLVRNRAVVISFFYTGCNDSCPLTNSRLARLRQQLKSVFGRSIHLISISVDAENDTPAKIARYAQLVAEESADPDMPDWQFLTGDAAEILKVRQQMGVVDPDPQVDRNPATHGSMLVFGNHGTGRWSMLSSKLPVADIMNRVKRIAGWTQELRYEDIRNEVRESKQPSQVAAIQPAAAGASSLAKLVPPVLGRCTGKLAGRERNGSTVHLADLRGKVTLLGHLYTLCPHGSLPVIEAMRSLQNEFGMHPGFHQVSLSAATERENPAYFRSYASGIGVGAQAPWWFVTAERSELDTFTTAELGLTPSRLIPEEQRLNVFDLYENDLRLVLLDSQGQVRGRYQIVHPDPASSAAALDQLRAHVRHLLSQPAPPTATASFQP